MITAVILTKNEETHIVDCIESVSFCDEVIVIDDNSTDRTVELAKRAETEVFTRALEDDFSAQRNFGLGKAKGEWVLFVDADERVSASLRDEIIQLTNQLVNQFTGFYIKRTDFMWGKELKYGETGNIKLLRLARKDAGRWEGKVHEEWRVKGLTGELTNHFYHYPHPTVGEFLEEINRYTDIRARQLYERGSKAYWWSIILYPKLKFFLNYFIRQGFRDGVPGLVIAIVMSFHSFLVRGKLWLLWRKK